MTSLAETHLTVELSERRLGVEVLQAVMTSAVWLCSEVVPTLGPHCLSWKGGPEEDHPGKEANSGGSHMSSLMVAISFECLGYATPHPENMLEETACVARPQLWNVEITI
ncbi:rCG54520 [Rattus norvegicus]|uniref:RCG54520 n=1 Tax=Rattus norvegicus TaxID=10116 RepID=A6JBF6_RAT|nr:rCG54520 [Rattus norvegicus]